jgi:hypothetical protein
MLSVKPVRRNWDRLYRGRATTHVTADEVVQGDGRCCEMLSPDSDSLIIGDVKLVYLMSHWRFIPQVEICPRPVCHPSVNS